MIADLATLDQVRRECRKLVTRRALLAAGAAAVPIPGADIAADIGLLATLLPDISRRFELDEAAIEKLDPHIAQRILVVAAGLGNNMIGRAMTKRLLLAPLRRVGVRLGGASAARYVPVIGSAVSGTIGFAAMKMVGNAHIEDCYRTAKAIIPA